MRQKPLPKKKIRGNRVSIRIDKGEILIFKDKNSRKAHCLCGDLNTLLQVITHRGSPRLMTFKKRGDLYYFVGENRNFSINKLVAKVDRLREKRLRQDWTTGEWENLISKIGSTTELKEIYIKTRNYKGIEYNQARKEYDQMVKNLVARKLLA